MYLHVVIVGLSGAGKSSLINILCPGANALTSNDGEFCTKKEEQYMCDLSDGHKCIVHDTVSIPERDNNKQERYLRALMNRGDLYLLVYCMSA